jgi:hypothetical protein
LTIISAFLPPATSYPTVLAPVTLLIVKSLLGASNTTFLAPSSTYLFISFTTISSFSVPADALP